MAYLIVNYLKFSHTHIRNKTKLTIITTPLQCYKEHSSLRKQKKSMVVEMERAEINKIKG